MIDVPIVRSLKGSDDFLGFAQKLIVEQSVGMAADIADFQMLELDAENGPLDAIHPRVPTDLGMVILAMLPVIAKDLDFGRQFLVIGGHAAGFSDVYKRQS